jgi:hypothetical protein
LKLTLNWLKQRIDFDWPPEELAGRLTMPGLEIERAQQSEGESKAPRLGMVQLVSLTSLNYPGKSKSIGAPLLPYAVRHRRQPKNNPGGYPQYPGPNQSDSLNS